MRADFTVLVAATTFLTCNEKLSRVLGFPLTDDENLDLTGDNYEAVPAERNLKDSDKDSEGRMMPAGGAGDLIDLAAGYFYRLSGWGVAPRRTGPAARLKRKLPALLQLDEGDIKQIESLEHYWHYVGMITFDKLAESLGLTSVTARTPRRFTSVDVRGIKLLHGYIEFVNRCENTQHTVFETLSKHYDEFELSSLLMKSIHHLSALESLPVRDMQQEMMAGWLDKKLSTDELFDKLKIKDKGKGVLHSMELLTLSRYVEVQLRKKPLPSQYTNRKAVLPQHEAVALEDGTQLPLYQFKQLRDRVVVGVLSKGFGDGKFAIMMGEKLSSCPLDETAKAYMDAMLWRWKDQRKTDLEHVFDAESLEEHSQHEQKITSIIKNRYRAYQAKK